MSIDHPIVEDTRERIVTPANGVTSLTVPFYFQKNADIAIYRRATSANSWVRLDEGDDYSLAGANVNSGGTATLTAAANGTAQYRVLGLAPIDRLTSVIQGGSQRGILVDKELDRQRIISMELRRDADAAGAGTSALTLALAAETIARIAADAAEAVSRSQADLALASLIAGGGTPIADNDFDSLLALSFASVPLARQLVRVSGYAAPGDCGNTLLLFRAESEPSHPGKRQSLDGAWWEYATSIADPCWFGAKRDGTPGTSGGTDDTAALQDATDFAIAKALGRVSLQPGCYYIAASGGNIDPGDGDMSYVGQGQFATILQFDGSAPGTSYEDMSMLFRSDSTDAKGRLHFSGFQVRGSFTAGSVAAGREPNVEGSGAVFWCDYREEIVITDCRFYDLQWQVAACEVIGRVRVFNCTFERTVRDMVRFRSSPNVIITNNHFKHCDDDAVALHQAEYVTGTGMIREGIIVANNIFEDTCGIHILGGRVVSVHSNILRRCKAHAVSIVFDEHEGRDTMFSISVYNNQIYDFLGRVVAGVLQDGPAYVIGVFGHYATYDPDNGDLFPGRELDPAPYRDNQYVGQPTPAMEDVAVYGNRIRKTLPAVAAYSDWGFGEMFSATGFQDPAVTAAKQRPQIGILAPGAGTLIQILDNAIEFVGNGIQWGYNDSGIDSHYGGRWSRISRNTIRRVSTAGIYFTDSGDLWNLPVEIETNDIDCDPYFESTGRNGDGSGWTAADAGPCAIRGGSITGLAIRRNKFANCSEILRSIYSGEWDQEDNIVVCNPAATGFSTSNDGVGTVPMAGPGWFHQLQNCDPASADYGEQIAGMKRAASAMPSAGKYVAGHFVRSTDMGVAVFGYQRLTTGTGHTSGTDWKTVALT